MKIVSLIAQKGGTGKTTLALCLAIAAQREGHTVAIIDLDPQASATNWADRRTEVDPAVVSAVPARLSQLLAKCREQEVTRVFIDTPGKSEQTSLAAARAADLILMPCRPQIHDLETIAASKEIAVLSGNKPFYVVLNAVPVQGRRHLEARSAIEAMGIAVCEHHLVQRAAFGDAPAAGLSVQEYQPTGKAAREALQVHEFVSKLLNATAEEEEDGETSGSRQRFA